MKMSFQEQAENLSKRVGPGKPKAMAFAGLVLTVVVISFMAVFFFHLLGMKELIQSI